MDDRGGAGADGGEWDARTLARRLSDSSPRAAFANAWHTSLLDPKYVFALPDVSHTDELLADPLIETQ